MTSPNCNKPRIAFFSGSFDPFTRGHESIVLRSLAFADEVVVAIGINPAKQPLFSLQARIKWIEKVFAHEPRVRVMSYSGMTVDAARSVNACCIVRGVRSQADFAYEQQMALFNHNASGIDTIMLCALPDEVDISSSQVRSLIAQNADLSPFMPRNSAQHLHILLHELK